MPELSAQGIRKNPNPMLKPLFELLSKEGFLPSNNLTVVDYGCGQLRHVSSLLSITSRLILVDTDTQLNTPHEFYGKKLRISEFVKQQWPKERITILSSNEFASAKIKADLIFSVNVFDVVPKTIRRAMIKLSQQKLGKNGGIVVIAPRNDTWTLRICTPDRKYKDGYIFPHSGGYTYYKNWGGDSLQRELVKGGFRVIRDISNFRQVCVICKTNHIKN